MKRLKKLLGVALVGVISASFLLIGCGKEEVKAADTAKAFYNLYVLSDPAAIKEIGLSDEEVKTVMDTQANASKLSTKKNFTSGQLPITNEQLDSLYNAQMEAFKKLTVTIEETEKSGDTISIKITTKYIDLMDADTKAWEATQQEVEKSNITDSTKISELYVKNIIANFEKAEISADTKEDTFKFTKQKVTMGGEIKDIWMPTDMSAFGASLGKMITGL